MTKLDRAVEKRARKAARNLNLWWGQGWSATHKWMKEGYT